MYYGVAICIFFLDNLYEQLVCFKQIQIEREREKGEESEMQGRMSYVAS